jgi:hypothetical protein
MRQHAAIHNIDLRVGLEADQMGSRCSGGGGSMKRCVDVLCLDAEHIDRFLNQLSLGLPFVMTDGARRIEILPREIRQSATSISEDSN